MGRQKSVCDINNSPIARGYKKMPWAIRNFQHIARTAIEKNPGLITVSNAAKLNNSLHDNIARFYTKKEIFILNLYTIDLPK